uniref:Uncharacterized protein n=1 Tax=Trypanosoma congolense (strain IL3000) TaxID=1068625 RepID=G0UX85_TRYCI|nr:conserved hypothetical protein [Trypanosoma congolense IL3000]
MPPRNECKVGRKAKKDAAKMMAKDCHREVSMKISKISSCFASGSPSEGTLLNSNDCISDHVDGDLGGVVRDPSPVIRLASILHGCFLITMTSKAQLGISVTTCCTVTSVDKRLLESIAHYCRLRVSLCDIVECSLAFPEWISVLRREASYITVDTSGECDAPVGVKIKLLRRTIPSSEEAEEYLRERWGETCSWLAGSCESGMELTCFGNTVPKRDVVSSYLKELKGDEDATTSFFGYNISDQKLLSQLSEDLRASLTRRKLNEVLAGMRKEALNGKDTKEKLISRRQREERVLFTYDLVRVLLGARRSVCNMAELVHQIVEQNRFGDSMDNVIQQVLHLGRMKESGITFYLTRDQLKSQKSGNNKKKTKKLVEENPRFTTELFKATCIPMIGTLESVVVYLDRSVASRTDLRRALEVYNFE